MENTNSFHSVIVTLSGHAQGLTGHKLRSSGAILAMATLWFEQNEFLDQKIVISCLQTNLTQWFNLSLV